MPPAPKPRAPCIGPDQIAGLLEGRSRDLDSTLLRHLAICGRCRHELSAVQRLLADPSAELEPWGEAEAPGRGRGRVGRRALATTMAVAAGMATLLLLPRAFPPPQGDEAPPPPPHREGAITTTLPPVLVGPAAIARAGDSLRWTSAPHADRYRIRIFDPQGTVVWDAEIVDTALAIPPQLHGAGARTYLWRVDARTGWDRWVASDWGDFTLVGMERAR